MSGQLVDLWTTRLDRPRFRTGESGPQSLRTWPVLGARPEGFSSKEGKYEGAICAGDGAGRRHDRVHLRPRRGVAGHAWQVLPRRTGAAEGPVQQAGRATGSQEVRTCGSSDEPARAVLRGDEGPQPGPALRRWRSVGRRPAPE